MIISSFNDISIEGLAVAVSNNWRAIESLDGEDEKSAQRFFKKVGVKGRYESGEKQTTSDFGYAAANRILEEKGIERKEIGLVCFVSQTPDYRNPATACVLQNRLGLSEDCMAFDVNQGCSGFIYGMHIVAGLMEASNIQTALLVGGDTCAKGRKSSADNEVKLFGDAGFAVVLKRKKAPDMHMAVRTDGLGYKTIIKPGGGERHPNLPADTLMDGIEVFNFAIDRPPRLIDEVMSSIGTSPADYDAIVLHQANKMIIDQVARKAGFTKEQNLISIDIFGNTSSASIPTALVKYYGDCDNDEDIKFMACGFGIGLSWGAAHLQMNVQSILPLIHTDEYFEDGFEEYDMG